MGVHANANGLSAVKKPEREWKFEEGAYAGLYIQDCIYTINSKLKFTGIFGKKTKGCSSGKDKAQIIVDKAIQDAVAGLIPCPEKLRQEFASKTIPILIPIKMSIPNLTLQTKVSTPWKWAAIGGGIFVALAALYFVTKS